MPQLADEEVQGYINQQDGAPPHWHKEVRDYLNEHLPGRWVGRAAATDNIFCTWPPRSPDLTECDFFLWGFVKDIVYVPPLPKTLPELWERINTAIGNVTQDMLWRLCIMNWLYITPLKPNDLKKASYRTANLHMLHFIYLFNKYTYWIF